MDDTGRPIRLRLRYPATEPGAPKDAPCVEVYDVESGRVVAGVVAASPFDAPGLKPGTVRRLVDIQLDLEDDG